MMTNRQGPAVRRAVRRAAHRLGTDGEKQTLIELRAPCCSVLLRPATGGQAHLIGVQRKSLNECVATSNSILTSPK